MLRIERIDTLAKLEDLKKSWDEFLARCPSGNINLFFTHEWITTWWEHFGAGKKLWVLLVKDEQEIVGIAPLMIGYELYSGIPVRMLGFFRNKHISRADFIIPFRKREVIRELIKYFHDNSGSWDVLRLVNMPKESGNMVVLAEELKKSKLRSFPVEPSNLLYYLSLSGTWEDYYENQSKKIRKNIRYYQNQLEKAGEFQFVKEDRADDADKSMERLFCLEKLSWKYTDNKARFSGKDRCFHKSLARKFALTGGLDNRFLYINGKVAGGLHNLIYQNTVYSLLTYYDEVFQDVSPARNIYITILQEYMAADSLLELDFNGESKFVRTWAKNYRTFEAISACNTNPYSRFIDLLKIIKRALNGAGGR